jgi:putative lipoprotein
VTRTCLWVSASIVTTFFSVSPAHADDPDPWFGRDKALHFGATAVLASGGYAGTALATDDRRFRLAVGAGLGLGAGVAKELWDLSGHGDASWRDLTWDVVGTATGLAVALAIDAALRRAAPHLNLAFHKLTVFAL